MSSNQASTPARPFAPDDFRRKRPTIMAPPTGGSIKPAIRSPVTSSQSRPNSRLSNHDSIKIEGDLPPKMVITGAVDNRSASAKPKAPLTYGLKSTHFQELQDLADKEWQSRLSERRQSEIQRSSSPVQSALTKKALMIKSNSAQTLTAMSPEVQHRHQSYIAPPQREEDDSSLHFTPRSSWDASAAFLLGKSVGGSKRRNQHRTSTPVSDSEYDRYSTEMRASIETTNGAQSIVSSSSSRFSLGGDSTRELLTKGDGVKGTPANLYRDHVLKGRSRRAKSLFSSDQVAKPALAHIETKNQLSNEEKMGQMKRSNKLATMLGEEWRQQAGNDDQQYHHANISSSSPLKDIVARRNHHKQRRQSEPLQVPFLDIVSSRERQRSSSDAFMLDPGFTVTKGKPTSTSTSPSSVTCPPLTPLPLGVHPKAAALLGLCMIPSGSSPLVAHQRIEEQITPGNPTSSSSVEMLKDSESLFSMDKTYAELERMRLQDQGHDQLMEMKQDEDALVSREERRKRVRKISRWLGAAVPPHLVQPFPSNGQLRQQVGSGYNNDDAPPLPMTDYMSGTPLYHQRGSSENKWNNASNSATKPLYKAKAAVNAKLHRKQINDGIHDSSDGNKEGMMGPMGSPRASTTLKQEDHHKTSVKRNHKLTAVFGELPPADLLAEKSPTSPQHAQSFQHRNTHQSYPAYISTGPQHNGLPFIARDGDESQVDEQSLDISLDSRRASSQYRLSIESLEYLIRKNPPLLKDLVCALEEEDDATSSQATSRGSATPVNNVALECSGLIAHNSSQESVGEEQCSVDLRHQTNLETSLKKSSLKVTEMLENRQRERKVKRHQKLGRWFGELPPQADDELTTGVDGDGVDDMEMNTRIPSSRQRMAPRSAGSSMKPRPYPRQFSLNDVLTSIEGEVVDDDELHIWEKQELQNRLRALRNDVELI